MSYMTSMTSYFPYRCHVSYALDLIKLFKFSFCLHYRTVQMCVQQQKPVSTAIVHFKSLSQRKHNIAETSENCIFDTLANTSCFQRLADMIKLQHLVSITADSDRVQYSARCIFKSNYNYYIS